MCVPQQPLAQWQRINGERKPIYERMPSLGLAAFNRLQITLHHALIAQRTKLLQLSLADPAAGLGESFQHRLSLEALVEGNQFAHLVPGSMAVCRFNRRQL